MKINNFVSIIIPSLNEEKIIGQCLRSIVQMDYPRDSYEIILVDNGSTDRTIEIAKSFGIRVFIVPGKTISELRNTGAKEAIGDILAFIDADCIVDKNWLKNAKKYFSKNEVACFGSPPLPPKNSTWVQKAWFIIRGKRKKIQEVKWLESMNLFVRKKLFGEIGGFNQNLVTCEDGDFCYRISKYGKIISDKNITATHLGEARTIKEFFKKELWRGRSNLKGIFIHGIVLSEIPSIILPIFYLAILFAVGLMPIMIFFKLVNILHYSLLLSILLISPAFLIGLIKSLINNKPRYILHLTCLLTVYFMARALSIIIKIGSQNE